MEETRKPARKPGAATAVKPAARAVAKPAATKASAAGKTVTGAEQIKASPAPSSPSPAGREEMIRTAAYFRAQSRGFAPGYEWEDWLVAESAVNSLTVPTPAPQPRKTPARKPSKG